MADITAWPILSQNLFGQAVKLSLSDLHWQNRFLDNTVVTNVQGSVLNNGH